MRRAKTTSAKNEKIKNPIVQRTIGGALNTGGPLVLPGGSEPPEEFPEDPVNRVTLFFITYLQPVHSIAPKLDAAERLLLQFEKNLFRPLEMQAFVHLNHLCLR